MKRINEYECLNCNHRWDSEPKLAWCPKCTSGKIEVLGYQEIDDKCQLVYHTADNEIIATTKENAIAGHGGTTETYTTIKVSPALYEHILTSWSFVSYFAKDGKIIATGSLESNEMGDYENVETN